MNDQQYPSMDKIFFTRSSMFGIIRNNSDNHGLEIK